MIDGHQSSIVRPRAVPPMFTPVLTSNSQPPSIMTTPPRTTQQALIEMMGAIIRKHDPDAARLHDCIGQVRVFAYNSNDLRWENAPNIDGNLCAYERQQMLNNKICLSYAFAIINGDKNLIQLITNDMAHHADKLRLFYEVARNGRREVFCAHFITESDCLRLQTFLSRCIQTTQKLAADQHHQYQQQQQQLARTPAAPVPTAELQSWMHTQINGQSTATVPVQQTPTNTYRHQQPIILPNSNLSTTPQFGLSRVNMNATPTRLATSSNLAVQQPVHLYPMQTPIEINQTPSIHTVSSPFMSHVEAQKPIEQTPFPPSPISFTNGNNTHTEDPTSSLKRLLNIRSQTGLENHSLDDGQIFAKQPSQQNSIDLMPPSAFEPIAATPPSPVVAIGAERIKHRVSNPMASAMNREHFRHVLLHLIQNDDHFLDIIYQACLTYPPTSQ